MGDYTEILDIQNEIEGEVSNWTNGVNGHADSWQNGRDGYVSHWQNGRDGFAAFWQNGRDGYVNDWECGRYLYVSGIQVGLNDGSAKDVNEFIELLGDELKWRQLVRMAMQCPPNIREEIMDTNTYVEPWTKEIQKVSKTRKDSFYSEEVIIKNDFRNFRVITRIIYNVAPNQRVEHIKRHTETIIFRKNNYEIFLEKDFIVSKDNSFSIEDWISPILLKHNFEEVKRERYE